MIAWWDPWETEITWREPIGFILPDATPLNVTPSAMFAYYKLHHSGSVVGLEEVLLVTKLALSFILSNRVERPDMGEVMNVLTEFLQMEGKMVEHRKHAAHPYSWQLKPGSPPEAFTHTSDSYPSSQIYTHSPWNTDQIDRSWEATDVNRSVEAEIPYVIRFNSDLSFRCQAQSFLWVYIQVGSSLCFFRSRSSKMLLGVLIIMVRMERVPKLTSMEKVFWPNSGKHYPQCNTNNEVIKTLIRTCPTVTCMEVEWGTIR